MTRPFRRAWEKNWPELRSALRGDLPQFVLSNRPRELGDHIPVFCYHTIAIDEFEADLAFLKRNGYTTLDADELADHMEGLRAAPARSVVITVDDGVSDLYTRAFPLFRDSGFTAVAFIAPGLHERQIVGDGEVNRLCNWQEILTMHISGVIDFQSHTLEHRFLPRWPRPCTIHGPHGLISLCRSPARPIAQDLAAARALLDERLRKKVRHLAFPQYAGTGEAIRAGLSCGYRGFWWGLLQGRRGNGVGDALTHITRLSGDFIRRLPGEGRATLMNVIRRRYQSRMLLATPERARSMPRPSTTELQSSRI